MYLDLISIFSASSLIVTPSVMDIGLKSSGEAGGRGSSTTLATLSTTSGFPVLFFLTNLDGATVLCADRPFLAQSSQNAVGDFRSHDFSVLVRIRIFVLALGITIFLGYDSGMSRGFRCLSRAGCCGCFSRPALVRAPARESGLPQALQAFSRRSRNFRCGLDFASHCRLLGRRDNPQGQRVSASTGSVGWISSRSRHAPPGFSAALAAA